VVAVSYYVSLEQQYRKLLAEAREVQREEICAGLLDHDRYKWASGVLQGLRQAEALLERALKESMHN
jgi:hypothetical protein